MKIVISEIQGQEAVAETARFVNRSHWDHNAKTALRVMVDGYIVPPWITCRYGEEARRRPPLPTELARDAFSYTVGDWPKEAAMICCAPTSRGARLFIRGWRNSYLCLDFTEPLNTKDTKDAIWNHEDYDHPEMFQAYHQLHWAREEITLEIRPGFTCEHLMGKAYHFVHGIEVFKSGLTLVSDLEGRIRTTGFAGSLKLAWAARCIAPSHPPMQTQASLRLGQKIDDYKKLFRNR